MMRLPEVPGTLLRGAPRPATGDCLPLDVLAVLNALRMALPPRSLTDY
jgi:hypothetical protein